MQKNNITELQMKDITEEYYEKYKDEIITFNYKLIDSIGLKPDKISLKCGTSSFPCILYSSSMNEARILAKLPNSFFNLLDEFRNRVSLRFTFHSGYQKDISFFVVSKMRSYSKYECNESDCYFLSIDFSDKPPRDLILILGGHIDTQVAIQKRMEERIVITSDNDKSLGIKIMENFLFIAGHGKKCILAEISIKSAKILICGSDNEFEAGTHAMLLMKAKGLESMGEMVGEISRSELINEDEGLYSVIIIFNDDMVPPMYKKWISECIEILKANSMVESS